MMSLFGSLLRRRQSKEVLFLFFIVFLLVNGFFLWEFRQFEAEFSPVEKLLEDFILSQPLPKLLTHIGTINAGSVPNSSALREIVANDPNAIVKVFLWPKRHGSSEYLHIYMDGINKSPFLELHHNSSDFSMLDRTIWMGPAYAGGQEEFEDWCADYLDELSEAQSDCYNQGYKKCFWHIYVVHFQDWVDEDTHCPGIEALMKNSSGADPHQEYVHYYQRSIVQDRKFNNETNWIDPGSRLAEFRDDSTEPFTTLSFPSLGIHSTILSRHGRLNYPVRSDIVKSLEMIIQENYDKSYTPSDPIENLWNRPFDLAHFWAMEKFDDEDDTFYPLFRSRVSHLLDGYCKQRKKLSCFIGLAGGKGRTGRRESGHLYINQMLQTKIVVVTQRDGWEDHYRLMEALVSGAMVLTDKMFSLPEGYVDGKSLVLFHSADDLLQKLTYYIEENEKRIDIAREGRRLAMEQHRSWHRMEKIVFGRILTLPDLEDLVVEQSFPTYAPTVVEDEEDEEAATPAPAQAAANTPYEGK